ncbi:MAG: serine dehydrogenasease [Pseudomonadota bacterium]
MEAIKTDDIIRDLLAEKCSSLENQLDSEVLLVRAPMAPGIDDVARREIENISSQTGRRNQLAVVLETTGGSIEVVERMSDVFRHHFDSVIFVIPNFAYSAGTVLSLSGDEIYMDYYSILGPIDPQIQNRENRWVPGIGYLDKYNALIKKSAENSITPAELEFMVRKFDPAELFALEQAKKHSADLIEKWLCEFKFKDWAVRESSGEEVTDEYKSARAKRIADLLGDPTEWNSHGRGIPLRTLESDKVGLKIRNFGEDHDLNRSVREYYDLFIDYCGKLGVEYAMHSKHRYLPL